MAEATALAKREERHLGLDAHAFEPSTIDEAKDVAKQIVASRLFSKLKTPEQAFVMIMMCRELRIGMMAGLKAIALIEAGGELKPALEAKLMVALIRRHPDCEYFRITNDPTDPATKDKTFARWESKRRSQERPEAASFTLDQAEQLGLRGKDNWKKQPENMLVQRAASRLATREWSEVILGLPDIEEASEAIDVEYSVSTVPDNASAPSTTAGVVREALAKQGAAIKPVAEVLKEARETPPDPPKEKPKEKAKKPASNEGEKAEEAKKPDPPAPTPIRQRTPAALELYRKLNALQAHFLEQLGPERAKAAWFHKSGPGGDGSHATIYDEKELERRLELAELLKRKYLVATQINLVRKQASEFPRYKDPVYIDQPELHDLERLEQMLDADAAKLQREQEAAKQGHVGELPLEPNG